MSGLQPLAAGAFFAVCGLVLTIIACTAPRPRSAMPFMCLLCYCFAPLPFFLCGGSRAMLRFGGAGRDGADMDDDDEEGPLDPLTAAGMFVGGAFLAAGPCLALVMYHLGVITGGALTLTLLSGVCVFLTTVSVAFSSGSGDDEGEY